MSLSNFQTTEETPLKSHHLLGQPKRHSLHLLHGIAPCRTAWIPAKAEYWWIQKDRERVTSSAGTALKESLTPPFTISLSLHPSWLWHRWEMNEQPSLQTWPRATDLKKPSKLSQQSDCLPPNSSASLQETANERPMWFSFYLRQKLCRGAEVAFPKTQHWWLARRIL